MCGLILIYMGVIVHNMVYTNTSTCTVNITTQLKSKAKSHVLVTVHSAHSVYSMKSLWIFKINEREICYLIGCRLQEEFQCCMFESEKRLIKALHSTACLFVCMNKHKCVSVCVWCRVVFGLILWPRISSPCWHCQCRYVSCRPPRRRRGGCLWSALSCSHSGPQRLDTERERGRDVKKQTKGIKENEYKV